ncbi:hypothetical protein LEP1GSC192_0205 [Leptospira sp. B5-022]|nr:hypothetical protein LEP1GSC192_0205 [Leptospira sp. B5-022]
MRDFLNSENFTSVIKSDLPFLEVRKTVESSDPLIGSMANLQDKISHLENKAGELEKRISGSRLDIRV